MVYYSQTKPRSHFCRAGRSDATRVARPVERRGRPFGQRTCQAVFDVVAGSHETSRRSVGCRTCRAREERPHRELPPARGTDARRQRLAQPLPEILDRSGWTNLLPFWRKKHGHHPHSQTQPHHQATVQRAAGKSLRGMDGSGKSKALDGSRRNQGCCARKAICAPAAATAGSCRAPDGEDARCQRRLPGGHPERETCFHLGLEVDAGARIARDTDVQT